MYKEMLPGLAHYSELWAKDGQLAYPFNLFLEVARKRNLMRYNYKSKMFYLHPTLYNYIQNTILQDLEGFDTLFHAWMYQSVMYNDKKEKNLKVIQMMYEQNIPAIEIAKQLHLPDNVVLSCRAAAISRMNIGCKKFIPELKPPRKTRKHHKKK